MATKFIPFDPKPPARYTEEFLEPGWLWSRSTSGQGNEQQDLWILPEKPPGAKLTKRWKTWGWLVKTDKPNPFPTSIRCKKPKMSSHRGRTWDQCDVIDAEGNKLTGYLDTTWGECVYFQTEEGWRKALFSPLINYKEHGRENVFDFRTLFKV